jgi:DNA-directed RNA polymerase specialized sigma24 family protein
MAMVDIAALEPFTERATELLVRLAQEGDPQLAKAYDELLFEALYAVVRQRGVTLAMRAAESSVKGVWLPRVQPSDLDAIALDATVGALERARRTAERFDPARGDGASWALGAAGFAYIDAVRDFYLVRRKGQAVSVDPAELGPLADQRVAGPSPEHIAETRAALMDALNRLSADERYVVLAQAQYGMSYAEIAQYRFGDVLETKRVDTVLQSARRKLAIAERAWNAAHR